MIIFLGLVNYCHKFLPTFSIYIQRITCCKQETTWTWEIDYDQASKIAKELITSENMLTYYNPDLPLCLACDALLYDIGAVLSHQMPDRSERPIAFVSRSFYPAKLNYIQIYREALSLAWGVRKCNWLFYLITNRHPLFSIVNPWKAVPAMAAVCLQDWALFLGAHDYTIQFKAPSKC